MREKDGDRLNQSPIPPGNVNNSLSSLSGTTVTSEHPWQRQRERAESDLQVSSILSIYLASFLTPHPQIGSKRKYEWDSTERCTLSLVTTENEFLDPTIEPVS